ncbi:hypothetical protein BJY04DRAFT_224224 [Aspergillus karnatakaensis]|uniref:uncharacterized protein n=1 Tax=Aspergillus karnatakaensis TaxID=1810916 RepID=UPI003CCE18E3
MKAPGSSIIELVSARRDQFFTPRSRQQRHTKYKGWKTTLCLGSITSFIVLLLNLILVLYASLRHSEHGKSVLYSGSCARVKELSTGMHVLINMLSTTLLSASNFAMQCLSAPTRQDVDRAHARKKWLDIGVPSVRNLWRIPKIRLVLWLCLAASSVPLHLFYNSSVYSTIAATEYDIYVGNANFTSLTPIDVQRVFAEGSNESLPLQSATHLVDMADRLVKLTPQDCISAYATNYQSKYGSLVLVSSDFHPSQSPINLVERQGIAGSMDDGAYDPYQWLCQDQGQDRPYKSYQCAHYLSDIKQASRWMVRGYQVEYCLAEKTEEKCTLEYSLPLAVTVLGTNAVKAVLICVAVLLLGGDRNPLLTLGDAIASFLRVPDCHDGSGMGECLLTRDVVTRRERADRWIQFKIALSRGAEYCVFALRAFRIPMPTRLKLWSYYVPPWKEERNDPELFTYNAIPRRRWSSLSMTRWIICLSFCFGAILSCICLLAYAFDRMADTEGAWDGFGAVKANTMIQADQWPSGLVANTLIANVPQVVFSGLYFMVNSVLTSLTLAGEWNTFSVQRKGLRVSTRPQGYQRRTYFLSLPLRYGLPLIAMSGLLHWLMSQSIFLVRILAYTAWQERDASSDAMTLGYSPPAVVTVICVGSLLPAALVWVGLRKFKSGMPVAGSCSLAIAAACSSRVEREDIKQYIHYERLMWGVELDQTGVGHCAFSNEQVDSPEDGVVYQ